MQQHPLIDTGSELPSPIFTPRPGWGGKLGAWLKKSPFQNGFRLLSLAVFLFMVSITLRSQHSTPLIPSPTPTAVADHDMHHEVAVRGDSLETLASRAVDECLAEHPDLGTLSPVEHLWAVHTLAHATPARTLNAGDAVDFDHLAVAQIIIHARNISATTRQSLSPYLK